MDKKRKLQLIQLYILNKVAEVCKNNDLMYYLYYGTLLGAVRHKGFIPWDDDIDIAMKRVDYDKFLQLAQSELGKDFFVQHYTNNPNYTRTIIKVRLNGTKHIEREFKGIDMNQGIYIDIFPLDVSDDNKLKQKFKKQIINMLDRILSTKKNINVINSPIKELMKNIIRPLTLLLSDKTINKLYEFVSSFDKKGNNLACFTGAYSIKKDTFLKDDFGVGMKIDFEGFQHKVPSNYDSILTNLYGDYMKIPEKKDQITHDIIEINFGKYDNIGEKNEN